MRWLAGEGLTRPPPPGHAPHRRPRPLGRCQLPYDVVKVGGVEFQPPPTPCAEPAGPPWRGPIFAGRPIRGPLAPSFTRPPTARVGHHRPGLGPPSPSAFASQPWRGSRTGWAPRLTLLNPSPSPPPPLFFPPQRCARAPSLSATSASSHHLPPPPCPPSPPPPLSPRHDGRRRRPAGRPHPPPRHARRRHPPDPGLQDAAHGGGDGPVPGGHAAGAVVS